MFLHAHAHKRTRHGKAQSRFQSARKGDEGSGNATGNGWNTGSFCKYRSWGTFLESPGKFSVPKGLFIFLDILYALILGFIHSGPQRPQSFWSAPRIETSGRSRFFEHVQNTCFGFLANQICQIWPWVRDSRTSGLGASQRSRSLVLTKRIAASGDENGVYNESISQVQISLWLPSLTCVNKYSRYLCLCLCLCFCESLILQSCYFKMSLR